MSAGLIISAVGTNSGKTVFTLGLLRALRRRGHTVAPIKIGPDYIDPQFHARAAGLPCNNADSWAMRPELIDDIVGRAVAEIIVAEGVMGLFDGALEVGSWGNGSTADIARLLGWPVLLLLNTKGMAQTAGAIVRGMVETAPEINIAAVILNNVASARHEKLLRESIKLPIIGVLPHVSDLHLPSRHLGLVQAEENRQLEDFIEKAADIVISGCTLEKIVSIARPKKAHPGVSLDIQPPGQRIAVARDIAFGFSYEHILQGWRDAGAELIPFSPIANETPDEMADCIYLPGGYPELHAEKISSAELFITGLLAARDAGIPIHGECGGYMVLGKALTDAKGHTHKMAGLLGLETSLHVRSLHLGYHHIEAQANFAFGPAGSKFRAHEFHYAGIIAKGGDEALFSVAGKKDDEGSRRGTVTGSFMHIIADA
jgi:cobyrinic acid a,c-diamide synthase